LAHRSGGKIGQVGEIIDDPGAVFIGQEESFRPPGLHVLDDEDRGIIVIYDFYTQNPFRFLAACELRPIQLYV
jgi:hypothetical protein